MSYWYAVSVICWSLVLVLLGVSLADRKRQDAWYDISLYFAWFALVPTGLYLLTAL